MRASTSIDEALLKNERGAEVERFGAAHGEIVDSAVYGERADIAAAEEERFDDEAVGGEGETFGADLEDGLIVEAAEDGTAEGGQEDVAQQVCAEPAAGSVAEQDAILGGEWRGTDDHTVRRKW